MDIRLSVVIYSQRDDRWKNKKLGNSTLTLGGYGCAVTCLAMLCCYYGFEVLPDELNEKLKTIGGFSDGLMLWHKLTNVFSSITFDGGVDSPDKPFSQAELDKIDGYLQSRKPVVVWVDYNPDQPIQQHFVLIVGKQGNDYVINDPWTGDQALLCQRYGKPNYQQPKYTIFGIRHYSGTPPQPEGTIPIWVKNLKPFFTELNLKDEEVEPKVRRWKDLASVLVGHVSKWVGAFSLKTEETDSGITEENVNKYLAKVDSEISGLIEKEDVLTTLWSAAEKVIGYGIDITTESAQKVMLKALDAVREHVTGVEKELRDTKEELGRVQSKRVLDRFRKRDLLVEIFVRTMQQIFSIVPGKWKGGEE